MTAPLTTLHQAAEAVAWLRARVTGTLQTDSRSVQPGDGFIAWPGAATDGRAHVADALQRGAAACLVEAQGVQDFVFPAAAPIAAFSGLKAATGEMASQWFHDPSHALQVLAVTGTNGKTSSTWWLAEALNLLSKNELPALAGCAVVGTLGVGVPPSLLTTGMTTPDPVRLHRAFRQFADQGLAACAIEASSIGLAEHRLAGTQIRVGVFTNFTQDHLDYHGSMADYWLAKRALFDWPGLRTAVVNIDDPHGAQLHAELLQRSGAAALEVWSVSAKGDARIAARDIAAGTQGLQWLVVEGAEQHLLQSRVVGHYNVLNLLGVVATLRSLGVPLADAVHACAQLSPVPGRMEQLALPTRWKKPCKHCAPWRSSAVGNCGACSAAGVIVMPPSVRSWALPPSTMPTGWWPPATTRAAKTLPTSCTRSCRARLPAKPCGWSPIVPPPSPWH